jgi:hypothetical protein
MTRPNDCGRRVLLAMLILLGAVPAVFAQETIEVDLGTIGLSTLAQIAPSKIYRPLDMMGARPGAGAWGMGGAYVAQAQGVEAVSWNPAGIGWLERPSMTGEFHWNRSSESTSGFPDTFNIPNAPQLRINRYEVNLKSAVRAGILGVGASREMAGRDVSGAVSYRRYMDVTLPEAILAELAVEGGGGDQGGSTSTIAVDNTEKGGVDAAAATFGVEIIPGQLSAGVNLNYLLGDFRSAAESSAPTGGLGTSTGFENLKFTYRGFSTDLGLQYRREGLAAVGIRYTPGYTLAVTKGRWDAQGIRLPGAEYAVRFHADVAGYNLDVPSLLSIGLWYRVIPELSVALGYDSQKWAGSRVAYRSDDPFAGREAEPTLPLRDVSTIRFGLEGRFLKYRDNPIPVRLGYAQGPLSVAQLDPSGDNPRLEENWAGGDVSSSTLSFGVGFETGPLRYDLSYEVIDYKLNKWYFETPYDPFLNPQGIIVEVDRRCAQMRFSGTLNF